MANGLVIGAAFAAVALACWVTAAVVCVAAVVVAPIASSNQFFPAEAVAATGCVASAADLAAPAEAVDAIAANGLAPLDAGLAVVGNVPTADFAAEAT